MSSNTVNYLQDTNHMSFRNTEEEILAQSKVNYELEEKLAQAVNKSKEIPQEIAREVRKELFNSLLNVNGGIAADVVQDLSDVGISNTRTEDKNGKRDFVEHVKSTIKKIMLIICQQLKQLTVLQMKLLSHHFQRNF